jgi:WD40 repeat protein
LRKNVLTVSVMYRNDVKWVPCSARFALVGCHSRGTGAMQVYSLNHGKLDILVDTEKQHGFKCGTFGASSLEERHYATGDYEGRLAVWNLEHVDLPIFSVKAHHGMINCIDGCGGLGIGYGAPEIATGGRDGAVKIWDPRQRDAPVASLEPKDAETARDCWSVSFGNSFNNEERCVCAGYDNGDIKLYDLRTNMIRWETNVKNGVCALDFDRKDIQMNKLVCATLESQFSLFDLRTYHPKEGYASLTEKAHKSTVWMCKHLPQNREVFVTGGGNGSLNLYKYSYPAQRVIKDPEGIEKGVMGTCELLNSRTFSTQPINSFDWHHDKEGLCVFGAFDQSVRVGIVTKLNTL